MMREMSMRSRQDRIKTSKAGVKLIDYKACIA